MNRIVESEFDGINCREACQVVVLDGVKGFGPQKFKLLWDARLTPEDVLKDPAHLPVPGKTGEKLKVAIRSASSKDLENCTKRAERQIDAARKYGASILTYWDASYPPNLLVSSHPVPVLDSW